MPPASCTHTAARPVLSFPSATIVRNFCPIQVWSPRSLAHVDRQRHGTACFKRLFVNAPPRQRPCGLDGGVPAPWPCGLEPLPCTLICSAPSTLPPWRCHLLPWSTPQRLCHSLSRQALPGRTRPLRKSLQPAPSISVSSRTPPVLSISADYFSRYHHVLDYRLRGSGNDFYTLSSL